MTNEEILKCVELAKPCLSNLKRKDVRIEHVVRHKGMIKTILEEAMEERNA